jgi:surface antigen
MTLRLMRIALTFALLGGCTALPGLGGRDAAAFHAEPPKNALPDAVRRVLEQEPTGSRFRLPQSPWGAGAVIALEADRYDAASGRSCRRIVIDPDGLPRLGLACRLADGTWIESRVLHDGGRPLPRSES